MTKGRRRLHTAPKIQRRLALTFQLPNLSAKPQDFIIDIRALYSGVNVPHFLRLEDFEAGLFAYQKSDLFFAIKHKLLLPPYMRNTQKQDVATLFWRE
jgi:hypothetical protein